MDVFEKVLMGIAIIVSIIAFGAMIWIFETMQSIEYFLFIHKDEDNFNLYERAKGITGWVMAVITITMFLMNAFFWRSV